MGGDGGHAVKTRLGDDDRPYLFIGRPARPARVQNRLVGRRPAEPRELKRPMAARGAGTEEERQLCPTTRRKEAVRCAVLGLSI